jgi:hypothetical protein
VELLSRAKSSHTWQEIVLFSIIKVDNLPGGTILLHPALGPEFTQTLSEM